MEDTPALNMPAPDALIDYGHGVLGAAMFHYINGDNARFEQVAADLGFEVRTLLMTSDGSVGEDHPAAVAYEAQDTTSALLNWHPSAPDGWTLGGKEDTEEGPMTYFLRRKPEPSGTFACSICGVDTPHHHTAAERAAASR